MKEPLSLPQEKLRHPWFYSVAILRVVGGFWVFVNPWEGWIVWLILDYFDSKPWRYVVGMTSKEYEIADKFIDMLVYFLMLISSVVYGHFLPLLLLFCFRLLGQYLFSFKKDEIYLFLFPNIFEVYWLWAIAIPTLNLSKNAQFFGEIGGLLFLIVIKFIQETYKHFLGPRYLFGKSSKIMEKFFVKK